MENNAHSYTEGDGINPMTPKQDIAHTEGRKIFIDGDFNDGYEARVRRSTGKKKVDFPLTSEQKQKEMKELEVNPLPTEVQTTDNGRIEKLQAFKDYVHKRLDDAGIEVDPESEHKEKGCRIGGRLDIVLKRFEVSEGQTKALQSFLEEEKKYAPLFEGQSETQDELWKEFEDSYIVVLKEGVATDPPILGVSVAGKNDFTITRKKP